MKLNVHRLLQEHRDPIEGRETFDFSGADFQDYTVEAPARLAYTATPEGNSVKLAFTLTATAKAECARCLAPVAQPLCIEKEYRITETDLAEEFPELPFEANGVLDLQEFAYGEIVLEVPPILLCGEDCEGLCIRCGKPAKDCGCEPEKEIDPRLQGLLQLLEEED